MNANIEKTVKYPTCLDFQQMQPKERIIHSETLGNPWEIIGAYIFSLYSKHYLCIIDYHSRFILIKGREGLSADSLILAYKVISSEYGLPKKIISDADGNFVSEKFKELYRNLNIKQADQPHTTTKVMDMWKHVSDF